LKLNFKARSFILEAIEYRIDWYKAQVQRNDLDEDKLSELTNDLYYMRALAGELKKNQGDFTSD
jgi:hypothetical protein